MKRLYPFLAATLILQGCTSGTSSGNQTEPAPAPTEDRPAEKTGDDPAAAPDTRTFGLPATISDENLGDYYDEKAAQILPEKQEKILQLDNLEDPEGNDYTILGTFDCSDRFTTRLILRNSDWTETVGWLANYAPNNRLIDHLVVFYSDNVEAYRSIASVITAGRVEVTTDAYEYAGNEEKITTTKTSYRIDRSGRFVRLR